MSSSRLQFDPERISAIKEGYMVKSPPQEDNSLIRKRWHMRWFVLCYADGKPALFYFRNEKGRKLGKPIDVISLVGVEVYKQRCRMHGYPYVINIQTNDRLYHLCTTHHHVHEDWLEKMRDHYIPRTELARQSNPPPQPMCHITAQPRPSLTADDILCHWQRTASNASTISSANSMSGDEDDPYDHPYSHKPSYSSNYSGDAFSFAHAQRIESWHREHCSQGQNNKTSSLPRLPRPENISRTDNALRRNNDKSYASSSRSIDLSKLHGIEEDTISVSYVTMETLDEDVKKVTILDSEDEGIGRSGSDSSGTSSVTTSAPMANLLQAALASSINASDPYKDNLLGAGFVGPKLTSTVKRNSDTPKLKGDSDIRKANSVEDFSIL